jgi:nucleoside-diphosphate-sugar epimerase
MIEIICGGGGFLGSHLRTMLEAEGKTVKVMPVEMLLDINGMHDFLNEPYHFYYLAAYGNLHGQEDIDEIFRASVIKLLNLLQATKGTPCEAFITAGTTSEYGNVTQVMTEDMMLNPETFYGAAKASATHLAQVWAKRMGLPIVVFRPASITGAGEQSIHFIPTLIRSCLLGEVMPFVGEPVHDYVNVNDVCSALALLAETAKDHKGEIFNVGSGVQTSNLQIKEMVEHITKHKANINIANKINPLNLSQVWIADSTKLRSLGWKPKVTLFKSLKEMVWVI